MNMKGMRVLVTGADGFIGSHLVEALVEAGATVRAFVLYNAFNSWGWLDTVEARIKEEIEVFSGDIRDPFGVQKATRGCRAVFHLAALIAIPYSYIAPKAYVDTNVGGTLNVLEAARSAGVEKVIHTSTSEVYGTAQYVPIDESHPLRGQSPYAATKIGADQLALSYHLSFGTPVAIVRPFNTYGPRQSARAVIPTIILQSLAASGPLRLGAVETTRDFNYIEDTVAGFLAVGASDNAVGEVINIGSGYEWTIAAVAAQIGDLLGCASDIVADPQRLRPSGSEVDRLLADNGKARDRLGWQPRFAAAEGLRRGLQQTIEWFQQMPNRARYKAEGYVV